MTHRPDPEFQALEERLNQARRAAIPDLMEVRRCRNRFYRYIARCVREVMEADRVDRIVSSRPVTFDVINNDAPAPSAPRGFCSPVKTDEIRRFEKTMKGVFGDVGECVMVWASDVDAGDRS